MKVIDFLGFVNEVLEWLNENYSGGWAEKDLERIKKEFEEICSKYRVKDEK